MYRNAPCTMPACRERKADATTHRDLPDVCVDGNGPVLVEREQRHARRDLGPNAWRHTWGFAQRCWVWRVEVVGAGRLGCGGGGEGGSKDGTESPPGTGLTPHPPKIPKTPDE